MLLCDCPTWGSVGESPVPAHPATKAAASNGSTYFKRTSFVRDVSCAHLFDGYTLPGAACAVGDVTRELSAGRVDRLPARPARGHRNVGTLQDFGESAYAVGARALEPRGRERVE